MTTVADLNSSPELVEILAPKMGRRQQELDY
jgi:hypothetical protein